MSTHRVVCHICGKPFHRQDFARNKRIPTCYSCTLSMGTGLEEGDFNSARLSSGEMSDAEVNWMQEDFRSIEEGRSLREPIYDEPCLGEDRYDLDYDGPAVQAAILQYAEERERERQERKQEDRKWSELAARIEAENMQDPEELERQEAEHLRELIELYRDWPPRTFWQRVTNCIRRVFNNLFKN